MIKKWFQKEKVQDKLSKVRDYKLKTPEEIFTEMLKVVSGVKYQRELKYAIYYNVIGFKGVSGGVGTSTIVSNLAVVLAELGFTVCVVDTSILSPVQDVLLKTNVEKNKGSDGEVRDWFDFLDNQDGVLNQSSMHNNISVLSFAGTGRDLTHFIGNDGVELVEGAIGVLKTRFDIILLDISSEQSQVSLASACVAQKVISVFGDGPHRASNYLSYRRNMSIGACGMEKMRYGVMSNQVEGLLGHLEGSIKGIGVSVVAKFPNHMDVAAEIAKGKMLCKVGSFSTGVSEWNRGLMKLVEHLLHLEDMQKELEGVSELEVESKAEEEEVKRDDNI